jgi:hypothetical protein
MATTLDALLRIKADVQGANNIVALNRGLQGVERTAIGASAAMRGMAGSSALLTGSLGALAPLLTAGGIIGLVNGAINAGDAMNDLSQRTGVSVEALAKFKKAASTSGTDIDSVAKALGKLSKGMYEAATTGKGPAAEALKVLGISATDASGKLKSADQVTLAIANRFKTVPDGAAKTAIAMQLFGKAGAEMIPMLNMGGDAIDNLSVKMTTAFAQKADEYKDKMAMLSGKVGVLGADLAIALLPSLTAVTDAVTAGVSAFDTMPESLKAATVSAALLAVAWGPLKSALSTGGLAIKALAGSMELLKYQTALAGGVMPLLAGGLDEVKLAIFAIPGWGWAIAGGTALAGLLAWTYKTNKGFRDFANNLGDVIASDFKNAMDKMASLTTQTGAGISSTWNRVLGFAQRIGKNIGQAFAGPFGLIADVATETMRSVSNAINGMVNAIPKPIRDKLGMAASHAILGPLAGYAVDAITRASAMGARDEKSNAASNKESNNQLQALALVDKAAAAAKAKAEKEAAAAAKNAAAEAEKLAVEQQQLNEAVVRARIALDDNAFKNAMDLIRRRYDYENELQNKLQDNWVKSLTGTSREAANQIVSFMRDSEALNKRVLQARQESELKTQALKSASALDAVTSQGIAGASMPGRYPQSGIVARTGSTGDSTGPHLDIRWADGRPITKADADRYFVLNGKPPSSYGITSGYGPRSLYGRSFHAGMDFGTPSGTQVSLIGGASLNKNLGYTGAGGYAAEVSTPQGAMRILHLLAGSVANATTGAAGSGSVLQGRGNAALQLRNQKTDASVGIATADSAQANKFADDEVKQTKKLQELLGKGFILDYTADIKAESDALEKQNKISALRNKLQLEGMKPEIIDAEVKKLEARDKVNDKIKILLDISKNNKLSAEDTAILNGAIASLAESYPKLAANIDDATKSQLAFNKAMDQKEKIKQLSDGIASTITNGIGQAIDSLIDGTKKWGDSLKEIGAGILKDIGKQIIQNGVTAPLNKSISGGIGDLLRGIKFAEGGIMTSAGPVPLRRYASGGIANSPQLAMYGEGRKPEAYVPLPDGRSIPVKLDAAGALDRYPRFDSSGSSGSDGAPGGMAAGDGGTVLAMNFETTQFLGQDWVSKDQLLAVVAESEKRATAAGARAGAQQVASRMRSSPAFRRQVGI